MKQTFISWCLSFCASGVNPHKRCATIALHACMCGFFFLSFFLGPSLFNLSSPAESIVRRDDRLLLTDCQCKTLAIICPWSCCWYAGIFAYLSGGTHTWLVAISQPGEPQYETICCFLRFWPKIHNFSACSQSHFCQVVWDKFLSMVFFFHFFVFFRSIF